MAQNGKKKGKMFFERTSLDSKGLSVQEKTTSNWNPGKDKFTPKTRSKKSKNEGGTIVVLCGGENRSHMKRWDDPITGTPGYTKVRQCTSVFQDSLYGKNMRVANAAEAKGSKRGNFNCSVCGKSHSKS